MRILLFGGAGQLGSEFTPRARDLNFEIFSPAIGEVDITEQQQLRYLATQLKPDVILNFAAYTAVDKAEEERDLAFKINRDGAANVALAARDVQAKCIHVSTDYVFKGDVNRPLAEYDETGAMSVYGRSKREGEEAVLKAYPKGSLIVRTSSLHGKYGANFVHTMLGLFDQGKSPTVVVDQIMSPTWAGFLAEALLDLSRIDVTGIMHCSCKGEISWWEFAEAIRNFASPGFPAVEVRKMNLQELDRPAKRPQYSSFNLTRLESVLGRPALDWKDGLRAHLRDIGRLREE